MNARFKSPDDYKLGFTLVELSIVIIIIGLITGGVLGAQSLIKSAKISSTVKEIQQMGMAIKAFKLEYDELPGTLHNARDYWGIPCGTNSTDGYYGCNGYSQRKKCIDNSGGSTCRVTNIFASDIRRFFVHLSFSGIMPDIPFVTSTTASSECIVGETIPKSEIGGGYIVSSEINNKTFMYFFNPISFTHASNLCNFGDFSPPTTPRIVKSIDKKLDDGNGRRGIIRAISDPTNNAYLGANCIDAAGAYNVSNTGNTCGLRAELE